MCLGVPMQVLECAGWTAVCRGRGRKVRVDLSLVGEQVPGSWLLCSLAVARESIDAERAARIEAALDGLEAAMGGERNLDRHFADLIGRTPELPPHLAALCCVANDGD